MPNWNWSKRSLARRTGLSGENRPAKRDVEREDRVVFAAERTADIGAVGDDAWPPPCRWRYSATSVATLAAACWGDWTPTTSSSLRVPASYQESPASGSRKTWSTDWV